MAMVSPSFIPVTMTTLPLTLGPVESPAICRILGMSSNVPSLGIPSASCWLKAWSLCFAAEDMLMVVVIQQITL